MPESNVPEIIKYLTEDNLKLMYGRLNRRYLVVDALPSVDSLEPADKNVIYVVKETVGETVRYWPNVLDNDVWKPFGIGQADLDGKVDKVDAVEGHLVVADKNGNLVDADILPGTFVALAIDPSESIQPHATDLRKIWKAYQSGMPVTLLDNRPDGSGLYAHLNAAGYTWVDGNRMAEYLDAVDDDNRQCDGTIHGYRVERDGVVKFYEDDEHTVEIVPENGKLYCDDTVPDHDRVYLYNDGFVRALRFVQFSCNELIDDDPAWPSRRATRQVFYRMTEPYGSSSPDGFEVAYGESTADIHDQMVTGARIGDGKLLPVDDGVIVLPKSTAVNDGTLTITVGESEPVVFSANDSADRAVDIPVATDEVAGLVRITSDVDSDDPDAAITATAVLNELDSYVQKVDGATAGHIAVFTSEGSMSDSGISSTDVESAIRHDHTHDNKSILDEVTAPYTTEEHAKLAGIEAGAQVNVIETVKVDGTALTVTDKAVDIDMSDKADKVPGATRGNFAALDASGNLTDSGSKAADFATAEQGIKADAAYQKPVDGIPKSDLDSGVQASLGKADTALQEHQDISGKVDKVYGKGLSTNDFTDNDKYKLDNIEAGAQVNKIESISANGTALSPDANKNVDIPLATSEVDGLLPKEKFPLIPAVPEASADRIYSFDDTNGTSWQTIVREYVGNMLLDQLGNPVTDEEGEIMYEEEAVPLWLSYKGVEFGARRAYDDHTGANIHDSIASRTTMAQVTTAIETALAKYGGFVVVNSLVDGHPDVADPSARFIYLYKDPNSTETDPYTEWIYTVDNEWDVIGTTSVDLSPYYTSAEVESRLDTKVDKVTGKGLSTNDYTTEDKNKLTGIESGAQENIIESVKVAGSALAIDSKSVNVPEAGGTVGAWVKGVVSGEDKTRWDNWEHASIVIPSPVKQYLGIAYLGYTEGITIIPSHVIVENYSRFSEYTDLKSFDWKYQCNNWNDVTITSTPEILNLWKNNHDFTIETMFNTNGSNEWIGIGWGTPGYSGGGLLYSNPYWNTPFMISFTPGSVYIFRNGNRVQTLSTSVYSGNAWHHVAITYTATTGVCTIYMDGNSIGTYTITGTHETCSNFTGSFGECVTQFAVYDYVAYTENFSVPTIPHIYNDEYALKQ